MDPIFVIFAMVAAVIFGGLSGWFLAGKLLSSKFEAASERLGRQADAMATLEKERDEARSKRQELATELAVMIAAQTEKDRAQDEKIAVLQEFNEQARTQLSEQFSSIGNKLLEEAQEKFLKQANLKFDAAEKSNSEKIGTLISPFDDKLKVFQESIQRIEKDWKKDYGSIESLMGQVKVGQEAVLVGASRIQTTLRGASKVRGDWGELQFENLLESCGLTEKTDFKSQESLTSQDGLLRPDYIVNVPGGKKIVVDVKNVFNSYADANEAETEEQRKVFLTEHARNVRKQIDELNGKRYQDFITGSADFVVMFIPGEHVLYAALTQDSSLLEYALSKNVVLSSPLNFMSIALTIATIWRHEGMHEDAIEVSKLGKQLYDRLALVADRLQTLGRRLESTNKGFNDVVTGFEGQQGLMKTGREFEKLSIDTTAKDLPSIASIQISPTPVQSGETIAVTSKANKITRSETIGSDEEASE